MPDIRTSALGGVPFGTSNNRPTSPSIGQTYYNGTLGVQEIYTNSGWLPATGANDFNVTLAGPVTTATFTKEYFAGAYTINSALVDSTYDIYVYDTAGNQVGYTKSPSLSATGNFNKIVVVGGSTGDLLSFSYKTTFTATNTTSQVTAGAFITSVTPTALNTIGDTTTVVGGNFASNVAVYFVGSDNIEIPAKSIVRTSSSELIIARPDVFATNLGTYKVVVENPGITRPTGSSLHILNNAITAGTTPNWTTGTTLPEPRVGVAYSTTLVATDSEGTDIDYSVISGSLPDNFSLNNETGVITGTPTTTQVSSFTIRATDSGGNIVDRVFSIAVLGTGATSATAARTAHDIYTFNNSATNGLYWIKPDNGTARQMYCYFTGATGWIVIGRTGTSITSYTQAPGFYNDGNIPQSGTNGSISLFDWSDTSVNNTTKFRWFDPANSAYVEWQCNNLTSIKAAPDSFTQSSDSFQLRFLAESGNSTSATYLWRWAAVQSISSPQNVPNFAGYPTLGVSSPYNTYGKTLYYDHAAQEDKRGFMLSNGNSAEGSYGTAGLQRYSVMGTPSDGRTNVYYATGILTLINPR